MLRTYVSRDDAIRGDYMAAAMNVADDLEMQGYVDIVIYDYGDRAEVTYDEYR